MEDSTLERWQGISESGIVYRQGSLYDRFQRIRDRRRAKGKRYSLVCLSQDWWVNFSEAQAVQSSLWESLVSA